MLVEINVNLTYFIQKFQSIRFMLILFIVIILLTISISWFIISVLYDTLKIYKPCFK